jgi:hypothetical protein
VGDDIRDMFRTADMLVDVTRRCDQARARAMRDGATFREFMAYETLAEKQQLLAHKVLSIHRLANGKAFQ